jgi:hypothetical protein
VNRSNLEQRRKDNCASIQSTKKTSHNTCANIEKYGS